MTKPPTDKLAEKVDELWQFSAGLANTLTLFHWVGYGFLLLTLFDLIELFIQPRFMNPVWEFQMLGALVERVPVPLIGLVLVFFGEPNLRARWERPLLKCLSWVALLLAVLFILLIPLGISNTIRLDRQSNEQIDTQVDRKIANLQQVKSQLKEAKTEDEIEKLMFRLDRNHPLLAIENSQQLEEVKKKLASLVDTTEGKITREARLDRANRRLTLFKKSLKWNLGALVSGSLFFTIWKTTHWTRLNK